MYLRLKWLRAAPHVAGDAHWRHKQIKHKPDPPFCQYINNPRTTHILPSRICSFQCLWRNVSMITQFLTTLFINLYTFLAQMLRKLISSPRNRHSDPLSSTSLDLAYLTPNLIVMSTPASRFPTTLWRNPADDVKKFLDANHPDMWRVWSLRGEGSDYLDKDLDGKGMPLHPEG